MALQFNFPASNEENRLGLDFPEAYALVANYSGDKHFVTFTVVLCQNAAAKEAGKSPLTAMTIRVDKEVIDGQEGDTQQARIYAYIKTLPIFADATDV